MSTGDLKRCPQDRPASGRSWQLSKARPGGKGQRANEASPWVHHRHPDKPGTEFKKPGPLFSLGMQQRRQTEFHAAFSMDVVSCLLGLPRDHPRAQLPPPPRMSCVSTHSQDRSCVGEVAHLLLATLSCREHTHCPWNLCWLPHLLSSLILGHPALCLPHLSHTPTRPPTFPPDASSQLRPNISET